jgi:hypothetical protein
VVKFAIERHGNDDCLRISTYDNGPDIDIVVKNVGIYLFANKEINLINVEIVHIKTKEFLIIYEIEVNYPSEKMSEHVMMHFKFSVT